MKVMGRNQKPQQHNSRPFSIIYVRVSSLRQLDNASLATQEKACREFCERNGWQVLRVFKEEGESAKTADRTELQAMLRCCRTANPRPAYLVVYSLDRFARNGVDHDAVRIQLNGMGVLLRCVQTPLGETPTERAIERILSALPQLDNELRAERSVAGMKTRLEEGRWMFKGPLGYINGKDATGNKTLLHDSERAPHIKEAFELFATGLYCREDVRERINASGLRTKDGKPLSPESFNRLLRNPRYAGLKNVGAWEIEGHGDWQPIVSIETFYRVQEILAGRRTTVTPRKRNREEFPLRGFVRCGHCKKPLTASVSIGKMKVKYPYYHCQNKACEHSVNISPDVMHTAFAEFLHQQQPDSGYLRLFHKVVVDVWNAKQADAVTLARKLDKQVDGVRERKRKLNEAFIYQQILPRDEYEQMRSALNEELAAAELRLSEARLDELEVDKVLEFAEGLLLNAAEVWERCSLDQKQRFQQVLFPKGVEYADGVYRTQETSFLFKSLPADQTVKKDLVALPSPEV